MTNNVLSLLHFPFQLLAVNWRIMVHIFDFMQNGLTATTLRIHLGMELTRVERAVLVCANSKHEEAR